MIRRSVWTSTLMVDGKTILVDVFFCHLFFTYAFFFSFLLFSFLFSFSWVSGYQWNDAIYCVTRSSRILSCRVTHCSANQPRLLSLLRCVSLPFDRFGSDGHREEKKREANEERYHPFLVLLCVLLKEYQQALVLKRQSMIRSHLLSLYFSLESPFK